MKFIVLFLITMIGFAPALAQANALTAGDILLDKSSYKYDEIIKITGKVIKIIPNTSVILVILDPSGEVVWLDQLDVNPDNTFNAGVKSGGPLWYLSGVYTVQASYQHPWGGTLTGTTTFTYTADPSLSKVAPLTAESESPLYEGGDSVTIRGAIKDYDRTDKTVVTVIILDPLGTIVSIVQVKPDRDTGEYEATFKTTDPLWKLSGEYTAKVKYGSQPAEVVFQFTDGEALTCGINQELVNGKCIDKQPSIAKNDTVPPLILIPSDITVDASNSQGATVSYSVKVIDNVDGILHAICTPFSGSQFQIGENLVTCTASDFSGNLAKKSFKVIVRSPSLSIPVWIKDVATFWCKDEIDNASFIEAIQYLIDNEVINVPLTKSGSSGSQEIPKWIKNTACWWSQGSISDNDFASGLQYLVVNGIIKI